MLYTRSFFPIHLLSDEPVGKKMMSAEFSFEKTCSKITAMSKTEVIGSLLNFDGLIKLDYTGDYLEKLSTDKLRHILLAAVVTANRKRAS